MNEGDLSVDSRTWYREQQEASQDVGHDKQGATLDPVQPHPGEQAEQREGGFAEHAQQPHLQGRGIEHGDGDEWQRQCADRRTEQRDRFRRPQFQKVSLPFGRRLALAEVIRDSFPHFSVSGKPAFGGKVVHHNHLPVKSDILVRYG